MKRILFLFSMLVNLSISAQIQPEEFSSISLENKTRIFVDKFDSNKYFWIKKNSPPTHRISNGYFFFSNEYDFPNFDAKAIAFNIDKDWQLETEIKFLSGDVNKFSGLMWGELVFGKKMVFEFSSLGYAKAGMIDGFDYQTLLPEKKYDFISKTGNNTLVVRKYKDKYYFFINQHFIGTVPYSTLTGTNIGFVVAPNSLIRINYLKLWYIKE